MSTDLDFGRLGSYIVSSRVALGYRHRQALADASGISIRVLSDLENGRRANFDSVTIAALEQALEWETGSVAQIVGGYEPITRRAVAEYPADAAIEVVLRSGLPDNVKKRFAQILADDRLAADRHRIDMAHSLIEAIEATS